MDWVVAGVFVYAWIGGIFFGSILWGVTKQEEAIAVPFVAWAVIALTTVFWPFDLLVASIFIRRGKQIIKAKAKAAALEFDKRTEKYQGMLEETAAKFGGTAPSQIQAKLVELEKDLQRKSGMN